MGLLENGFDFFFVLVIVLLGNYKKKKRFFKRIISVLILVERWRYFVQDVKIPLAPPIVIRKIRDTPASWR